MIPRLVPEISPLDAFCDVGVVGVGIGDSRSWIHFWWIGFWKIYFWQIHYTSVHLPPELKSTLQRSPHRVRDLWETAYSSSFQEKCHSTPLHSSTVRCLTVKLLSACLYWSVLPSNAELGSNTYIGLTWLSKTETLRTIPVPTKISWNFGLGKFDSFKSSIGKNWVFGGLPLLGIQVGIHYILHFPS